MWDKIRLVFPVIFAGILMYHVYGYATAPKREVVTRPAYSKGDAPHAFQDALVDGDLVDKDEESKIQGEFYQLCRVLVARTSKATAIRRTI